LLISILLLRERSHLYVERDRRFSTWLDRRISGAGEVDVDVARDR